MIAIHKGPAPPGLVRAGEVQARLLCVAYEADPANYRSREKAMDIQASIYASQAVRGALENSHHGKCCYCETVIPKPFAYSYVDHWRPKSSSRQGVAQARVWPGYYWLAYTWDNLLLSCAFCNSNKSDLFPLEDPSKRALHHGMDLNEESPCILKPDGGEDPRTHIGYYKEVPMGLTPSGAKTVEVLGLDSPAHELRRTHFQDICHAREMYVNFSEIDHPYARHCAERLREFLRAAVRPDKPYSAMISAYLEANPLPTPFI